MDDIKVSVIVPVYNVEKYIEKCIRSILAQTYYKFELILVNDGSMDRSLEICRKFKNDCRVRIISQTNKGLSVSRNMGIHVARGKYLLFVDGDDFIAPNMIEELYQAVVLEEADIAQCAFIQISTDSELKKERYRGCITKKVIHGDEWFAEYERNSLLFTVVWNKLYKKSLFDKIRYPKGKVNEDEYVLFPLLCSIQKMVILNQGLYYYVQRSSSLSANAKIEQLLENYVDYSDKRLALLWKKSKVLFGNYLHMHFLGLQYYDNLVKKNHLNYKLVRKIKKKSFRLIWLLFKFSPIEFKKKVDILKWNLKMF